jgi:Escherichia/Staphylococcus phage prohead protease
MTSAMRKRTSAVISPTDAGEFTAIAACYTRDRSNERIVPGAFQDTIVRWLASGKTVPLHWHHRSEAQNIIGSIDPRSMRETPEGLEVSGKLDLEESETAKQVWRLMKANSVGLSFGYMVLEDGKGADGARELNKLDLFEVTITPAPANADTRFISLKMDRSRAVELERKARPIRIASFEVGRR